MKRIDIGKIHSLSRATHISSLITRILAISFIGTGLVGEYYSFKKEETKVRNLQAKIDSIQEQFDSLMNKPVIIIQRKIPEPIAIMVVKAKQISIPDSIASKRFTFMENKPPIANAGPDLNIILPPDTTGRKN